MFKDILVHLAHGPRDEARLRVALDLARRHEASLTGLAVIDLPSADLYYGAGMPFAISGLDELIGPLRADAIAHAEETRTRFRERAQRENVAAEWRLAEGDTVSALVAHARHADLTVLGQPSDEERFKGGGADAALVGVLLASGRPVLAIPYAGTFQRIGERVLVAWNNSREASRAVNDALPLLRGARAVTVLSINPDAGADGEGDPPEAGIVAHLARHGVRAEAVRTVAKDIGAGDALLSYAADLDADLIVAGGYGHSRAREMVFGGVTRTLLREMTVPVFLSH